MKGDHESGMAKGIHALASHIPIPYGCLTVLALVLGVLATVVCTSVAIGIALLK